MFSVNKVKLSPVACWRPEWKSLQVSILISHQGERQNIPLRWFTRNIQWNGCSISHCQGAIIARCCLSRHPADKQIPWNTGGKEITLIWATPQPDGQYLETCESVCPRRAQLWTTHAVNSIATLHYVLDQNCEVYLVGLRNVINKMW